MESGYQVINRQCSFVEVICCSDITAGMDRASWVSDGSDALPHASGVHDIRLVLYPLSANVLGHFNPFI